MKRRTFIAGLGAAILRPHVSFGADTHAPLFINGEFLGDQEKEGGVYVSMNAEHYCLDGLRYVSDSPALFEVTRSDNAPAGFLNSIQVVVTRRKSARAPSDNDHLEWTAEGPDILPWKWGTTEAQPMTIQFESWDSEIGHHPLGFMVGNNSCHIVKSYLCTAANVWTPRTITIPALTDAILKELDASITTAPGTISVKMMMDLGSADGRTTASPDAWSRAANWRFPGSVDYTVTGGTKRIAALQSDVGLLALPFRHLPREQQVKRWQRYYWKTLPQGVAFGQNAGWEGAITYNPETGERGAEVVFPAEMVGAPTIITANPRAANDLWANDLGIASGRAIIESNTSKGCFISNDQSYNGGASGRIGIHASFNQRLGGA